MPRPLIRTAVLSLLAGGVAAAYPFTRASLAREKPAQEKPADGKPADETPADAKPIEASDKKALDENAGKQVAVVGTVSKAEWGKSGKVMTVEFADSELLLAVFDRAKAEVNEAFEGDAAKAWAGAKVKVTGKLATYGGRDKAFEGRPQIIVSKASQVTVAEKKKE
jgi:hypothetical protein